MANPFLFLIDVGSEGTNLERKAMRNSVHRKILDSQFAKENPELDILFIDQSKRLQEVKEYLERNRKKNSRNLVVVQADSSQRLDVLKRLHEHLVPLASCFRSISYCSEAAQNSINPFIDTLTKFVEEPSNRYDSHSQSERERRLRPQDYNGVKFDSDLTGFSNFLDQLHKRFPTARRKQRPLSTDEQIQKMINEANEQARVEASRRRNAAYAATFSRSRFVGTKSPLEQGLGQLRLFFSDVQNKPLHGKFKKLAAANKLPLSIFKEMIGKELGLDLTKGYKPALFEGAASLGIEITKVETYKALRRKENAKRQ